MKVPIASVCFVHSWPLSKYGSATLSLNTYNTTVLSLRSFYKNVKINIDILFRQINLPKSHKLDLLIMSPFCNRTGTAVCVDSTAMLIAQVHILLRHFDSL